MHNMSKTEPELKHLNLKQMLNVNKPLSETIEPPGWGGKITVRGFKVSELARIHGLVPEMEAVMAICFCLVDPDTGAQIVSEKEFDEVSKIFAQKPAHEIVPVYNKIKKLTNIGTKPDGEDDDSKKS